MKNTRATSYIEKKVADLTKLIESISLIELVTPDNLTAERRAWLERAEHDVYTDPLFVYNVPKLVACAHKANRLKNYGRQVLETQKPENAIDEAILKILRRRIDSALLTCEIAEAMLASDNKRIRELLVEKYGKPDVAQVHHAYALSGENLRPESRSESMFAGGERSRLRSVNVSADELRLFCDFALIYYGFEDWHCEQRKDAHRVDVRTRAIKPEHRKRIELPTRGRYNGLEALELVAHEVEYHVRNIANCEQLFTELLGKDSLLLPLVSTLAKADDESLYEGVAKNSDVRISGPDAAPDPCYIIAIDLALQGLPFSNVAAGIINLRDYTRPEGVKVSRKTLEYVWNICYRVFRGYQYRPNFSNEECYAFTKDYAYLSGFNETQRMDPILRDFASLRREDIADLQKAGVILEPAYPYRRVAREIWDRRNSTNCITGAFYGL